MTGSERLLYCSPNGDTWYLSRDSQSGRPVVKHVANEPSGGRVSHMEIGAFLAAGAGGPEHQELLRLIGTLTAERNFASERSSSETGPNRKPHRDDNSYEVDELVKRHGISNDQASRLIRQIGADRDKLDAEAAKLTKR